MLFSWNNAQVVYLTLSAGNSQHRLACSGLNNPEHTHVSWKDRTSPLEFPAGIARRDENLTGLLKLSRSTLLSQSGDIRNSGVPSQAPCMSKQGASTHHFSSRNPLPYGSSGLDLISPPHQLIRHLQGCDHERCSWPMKNAHVWNIVLLGSLGRVWRAYGTKTNGAKPSEPVIRAIFFTAREMLTKLGMATGEHHINELRLSVLDLDISLATQLHLSILSVGAKTGPIPS